MKKYGITLLGAGFLFLAFGYFLKMAVDLNWIPPAGRAAIGMLLGVTGLFAGYTQYQAKRKVLGEIIAGFGTGLLYATFAYASFAESIQWSGNTLAISMIALSSLVTYVGYKMEMRILVYLSFLGGFLTPIIIKASPSQDWMLFGYMLVLNVSALWLSASKNWQELRVMSFVFTLILFCSYYFYFEPENWGKPMFFASAFFLVYMLGLIGSSWFERKKFEGLNLYLGLVNAIHFVFWSIFILQEFSLSYALPTMLVGVIFLAAALTIRKLSSDSLLPVAAYAILGILVIAIAAGDMGLLFQTAGMNYVVTTSVWLMLGAVVFAAGWLLSNKHIRYGAVGVWTLVMIYWFMVAWDVQWVEWFGVTYIPFINPGALVWMLMAAIGFTFSRLILKAKDAELQLQDQWISTGLAVASHIVIGGLLTIQIANVWDAYQIDHEFKALFISLAWFIYAFSIFLWGAFSKNTVFRWMGYVVLVISSIKVLAFDLSGEATLYKVGFLAGVGVITLAIGLVNKKWLDKSEEKVVNTEGLDAA